MESQRVRLLTEGYLRGWLKFDNQQKTSRLREEIIINAIFDDEFYALLRTKLYMDSMLCSAMPNKPKELVSALYETYHQQIGLKLPSLLPQDKIEKDTMELTKENLAEWRELLSKANKKA